MIKVDLSGISGFAPEDAVRFKEGSDIVKNLLEGEAGLEGTGWLRLPEEISGELLSSLRDTARRISGESEVLVVIGAGGSYLGARAAVELLRSPYYNGLRKNTPDIFFCGNSLSAAHLSQIIALIGARPFSILYISKSGSTLEPSVAFRVMRALLIAKAGEEEAKSRIYTVTDAKSGRLRAITNREGYKSFEIPADVGGRYSVLSPVGLLPILCAGIDAEDVLIGARDALRSAAGEAARYAAARQALYGLGYKIELLASFEPSFKYMGEWWKQLFGESEGKGGRGIFPACADYTADLHSLGQYVQEGERALMETFVLFEKSPVQLLVPPAPGFGDGLDPVSGKMLSVLNDAAAEATKAAHIEGGVPVITITAPDMSPYSFGALVMFFELACAVSALLMPVNPFDQPGVEAYKTKLKARLNL
jgi:glucose-6-phosphate isomerase